MQINRIPQFGNAHFYKYRPWDKFSQQILMENTIYFSSPSIADDPFDCRFPDIPKPTSSKLKDFLEIQRLKQGSYFFEDDTKIEGGSILWQAYLKIYRKKQAAVSWDKISEEAKNIVLSKSSFCSLSSVNNSPLLFAHYSDSHRGVCFEFHHTLEFSFAHVEAVQYQDSFEKIDIFDDLECCDETLVQAMMFRKSSDWSHQNEWRAFRPNIKPSVKKFDPRCLSGIILGCKMTEDDRLEVIKIAKQRVFPITVYEAILKDDGIGIEIRKVQQANSESTAGASRAPSSHTGRATKND